MFNFEYVAYGILAITALFVIFNLLKGLIRGFKKTIGTLVAIVLSVIIATIVTVIVCKPSSAFMVMLMDYIKSYVDLGELFDITEIGEALSYYVSMIIAPFFFLVAYSVISILVSIIVAIVIRFIPPKGKQKGALHRLGGLGVGALCGVLVSIIMLMPIVGFINIAVTAGETLLADNNGEAVEIGGIDIVPIVNDASNNGVLEFYSKSSGWMFDILASVNFGGETVYLRDDVSTVLSVVPQLSSMAGGMSSFDRDTVDAIDSLIDALDSSALLKHTVAGVISEMAGRWNAGETFMGMGMISVGDMLDPMIHSMIEVFATTTKDTVSADLKTVTGVFGVLVDHDMLSNMDNYEHILSKLGKEGIIKELILVTSENERMVGLSDEITRLSIRALAITLDIPRNADELYDDIMGDIVSVINDSRYSGEDRRDMVADSICASLEDHGLEIEEDQALVLADSLISDLGSISNIGGDIVEEFFLVYSASAPANDAYYSGSGNSYSSLSSENAISVNSDGTISIGDRVLQNYNAANYGKSAAYKLGQSGESIGDAEYLYSAKKTAERSSVVTLDVILSHVNSYADSKDLDLEAQNISDMFSTAADLFSGGLDNKTYDELIADMGKLLDKMRNTEVFGADAVNDVMKAILQSQTVKEEMGLTATEASTFSDKLTNLVNDDYTYADATNTVSTTISMVNAVKDENISKEERRENTQKLIEDLDPDKADMLSSMVTPSSMMKYGAKDEKAQSVSNSVSDLFNNMANFTADPGSDAYKQEADAVNTVLDLAMKGSDADDTRRLFGTDGEGKLDTNADDFVSLVVNSEVVSATIIGAASTGEENPYGICPTDDDREELSLAMEAYYAENSEGKTAEEIADLQARLNALAVVTDMPIMFPES